ncbi:hypothetical protein [Sunxiuqinia elliptica]|uniref:Uncharacterized protein n=1 Tax=Sunxiuqinia elliptica TaxID=655355 RepID=A0A1I2I0U0_9BACT|nr:hypothetical protein [Sunxiuqinia elliptica]SFF35864.1 hypothetical protein SAMN05216283_10559 [Sunxiuqinia elliptica]
MIVRNLILSFTLIIGLFLTTNSSFGQKVTTQDFLEEFNINQCFTGSFDNLIEQINPNENSLNKKIKSKLDDKLPIVILEEETPFPSPCNLHKFNLEHGIFSLELISLGNMGGFKKTIMLPVVKVYDENGELLDSLKVQKYETRSPSSILPFHIYSLWEFKIDQNGYYYIQVTSENSSSDDLSLDASNEQVAIAASASTTPGAPIVVGAGAITSMLLKGYPVKRSPFGKYRIILEQALIEK